MYVYRTVGEHFAFFLPFEIRYRRKLAELHALTELFHKMTTLAFFKSFCLFKTCKHLVNTKRLFFSCQFQPFHKQAQPVPPLKIPIVYLTLMQAS